MKLRKVTHPGPEIRADEAATVIPPSESGPERAASAPSTWLLKASQAACNICGTTAAFDSPTEPCDLPTLRESLGCRVCEGISRDRALVSALAGMLRMSGPLLEWRRDRSRRMFETSGYRGHPRYLPEIFDYYNLPFAPPPTDESDEPLDPRRGADLQDLQFPDGFFDVVMTAEVLEHVPDEQRAIREIARVLKPGGHLILEVPYGHALECNDVRVHRWHGRDVFLSPPEYHAEHTLVYRIYGRQLLEDLAAAGLAVGHLRLDIPELAVGPQSVIVATKARYLDLSGFQLRA
jgi:SAM-dependent methyltransferase